MNDIVASHDTCILDVHGRYVEKSTDIDSKYTLKCSLTFRFIVVVGQVLKNPVGIVTLMQEAGEKKKQQIDFLKILQENSFLKPRKHFL